MDLLNLILYSTRCLINCDIFGYGVGIFAIQVEVVFFIKGFITLLSLLLRISSIPTFIFKVQNTNRITCNFLVVDPHLLNRLIVIPFTLMLVVLEVASLGT